MKLDFFFFQAQQGGQIGIVVVGEFMEPLTNTPDDIAASERYLDFLFGWLVLSILNNNLLSQLHVPLVLVLVEYRANERFGFCSIMLQN